MIKYLKLSFIAKLITSKWLVFFLLLSLAPALKAQQTLTINTPGERPYHYPDQRGYIDQVVIEAFRRLNITVTMQLLPMERSLVNVNEGIEDGDAGRIPGLEKFYPNLIMVSEKILDSEFVAFTKGLEFPTTGWETLRPFDVGIIQGFKICEANIKHTRSLTKVEDVQQLFQLLDRNRVDVVVGEKVFGSFMAKELKISGIKILRPALAKQEMYIYLHKKHAGLVPRLTKAIQTMKADGTYQRLMQGVEKVTSFD